MFKCQGEIHERRYSVVNNAWDALEIVEGDSSSKGLSDQVLCLVSATGCASTLSSEY